MSKLDEALEGVAVASANQYGGFEDWETPEERAEVIDTPKQLIKDLILELINDSLIDVDVGYSDATIVKKIDEEALRRKVNAL